MSARPWFAFFPGDWQSDTGLKMSSLAAQGLWLQLLCLMHGANPRGHLVHGGKPIEEARIAKIVGCGLAETRQLIAELEAAGVFDRAENGAIVSRKMVRDEQKSAKNSANVTARWDRVRAEKKEQNEFGNTTGNTKPHTKLIPHIHIPESSSPNGEESSQGRSGQKRSHGSSTSHLQSHVDAIWAAAPKTSKARSGRELIFKALADAAKTGHDPATVVEATKAYFVSDDCTADGFKYAKGAHLVIRDGRWQAFASEAEATRDPTTFTDDAWRARLKMLADGKWSDKWGPRPGNAGCLVPARLLISAAA